MKRKKEGESLSPQELFGSCPIPRAFFTLAIPCVLGKLVMLIYNLADTWFVAQTGNTALVAGVSLGTPVLLMMVALGDVFGQGGASLITRMMGMEKYGKVKSLTAFCFWCGLGCGAVLTVILLVFQQPVLYLIGADDTTYAYAAEYYRWLALGAPMVGISIVSMNVLRTEGLATESMKGSVLGSVFNMILDPILILGLGMGAAGAAIASVLGYVLTNVYYIHVYLHRCRLLSILPRGVRIARSDLIGVVSIGLPASLSNVMQSVGLAMANRYLLVYGSDKIAAMGIALKIYMVVMMVVVGFSFGPLPLVGYNYGAGNYPRLKGVIRFMYTFILSITAGMAICMALLARVLVGLFLQDEVVIGAGTLILRAFMLGAVFAAFVLVTTCVFQATGNAGGAMLLSANRQGVLYFILLTVLSVTVGYYGVVFAQCTCDILCAVMGSVVLVRMLRGLERS